jgi:hypothetical protein
MGRPVKSGRKKRHFIIIEVFTAVIMKVVIFWKTASVV